ncbi:MAG: thioredoxin [Candidatus Aenigmatarchaeota archaeon]|nr:MAG: thioredoxin [Candidatus Aenigmarchaeota archaeon]
MEKLVKNSGVDVNEIKIDVNDSSFEREVIEKSKEVPVVIDFWAPWCAPCLMLGPVLEKFAEEYKGKFILAKVNVDENPQISQGYNIMSIPSVKMFKGGVIVDEFVGALPELSVKQWLDKNLGD